MSFCHWMQYQYGTWENAGILQGKINMWEWQKIWKKEQYGYLPLLFIKTYHKEIIIKIEGYLSKIKTIW